MLMITFRCNSFSPFSASVPEDLATRRLQFVGEKAGMLGEENRQLPVSRLDRWNHHDKSNLLIGQALQRGACGGINAWQIRGVCVPSMRVTRNVAVALTENAR